MYIRGILYTVLVLLHACALTTDRLVCVHTVHCTLTEPWH